jgi:hypothetical protein
MHISAQPITAQIPTFKIDDFKKVLMDSNEVSLFGMLVTSNMQTNNTMKVPTEALFINWRDIFTYTYKSATMDNLGTANADVDRRGWKGSIDLSECNLAHRMIAKGFSLMNTTNYLLETFTL